MALDDLSNNAGLFNLNEQRKTIQFNIANMQSQLSVLARQMSEMTDFSEIASADEQTEIQNLIQE